MRHQPRHVEWSSSSPGARSACPARALASSINVPGARVSTPLGKTAKRKRPSPATSNGRPRDARRELGHLEGHQHQEPAIVICETRSVGQAVEVLSTRSFATASMFCSI
jgi:hypothetical protein